ncbi:apoptosis facilitator Bcl-2-like protein 14 isoform X1 [Gambusia affinis]|uniref:apoptosis facilitator Bcl-2-like protein 14 isoform X1 n=1 Tax=Gambusia affinis TaxID=33528 RepID=UPI001CDD35C9|nr:apoptosis facilitator Bcl-2-like protein 14 isoform X1 [Gambusia affinis]XP_043963734.1 apoptosis facilitator Bcl-2-like protein 14 isoform X1 [Gambusia affinis]
MENGKVENRVSETIDSTAHLDCNLNSDKENMEDTVEFRLMMAYAQRRRPAKVNTPKENGSAAEQSLTQTSGKTENKEEEVEEKKKKKKKKIWRHLKVIFKCVQPQTVEPESPQDDDLTDPMYRKFVPEDEEVEDQDAMQEVADRVIGIADEFDFTTEMDPCIESDAGEDDVEKMIGLLLRDEGDRLTEEFDLAHIAADLFLDYSFFARLLNRFLIRIGFRRPDSDALGPQAANRTQIAAALEITSRLASVEALPKVKLYKHGARYLQEYYSLWAQTQGGYEAVFPDEEEVD